jgi:acetyl-CoA carboxylase carboxyltransferase component
VSGRECVVVANDATVKGGTYPGSRITADSDSVVR